MKTLLPFQFHFSLMSRYATANGLRYIHYGALIISGAYYYCDNKAKPDHIEYELVPGTTLTNLMEWMQYNGDEGIADAIELHMDSLTAAKRA